MDANDIPSRLSPKVNTSVAEFWCCTGKENKFSYMWTINNLNFYYDKDKQLWTSTLSVKNNFNHDKMKQLKSSTFSSKDKSRWFLRVISTIRNKKNFLLFSLHLVTCDKSEVVAEYTFSIIRAVGENIDLQTYTERFTQGHTKGTDQLMCIEDLLDKGLLTDDKLMILFKGRILTVRTSLDSINISGHSDTIQIEVPECRQLDILGPLSENQKLSDVTLTVCGRKFQAHKAILAAQSPVFLAMFEHEMEERKTNCVDITDMECEVVREMLRFMYTGKVANLEKIADVLLAAADKYALEKLKIMCEEALYPNLTIENVAEMLMFADLHSADQLKSRAIDFIITNATYVMDTEGFKSMVNSHPHLIVKAIEVVTQQTQHIQLI